MSKAKKVLVTGGAGFIGSHVAEELIGLDKKVIILDNLSGGSIKNVPLKAEFIKGSILDTKLLDKIFLENKISHIYHLAAYAAEGLSHFIKKFNYENNLIGSVNLINRAINFEISSFVFTSSIAVYGDLKPPFKETMRPKPADSYGIAKLAVEKELSISKEMFDLNYVIFRPHNVYGERQNIADKYRNVIGIFMNQAMKGEPLTIFGNGQQTRAFTYIKDISLAIVEAGLKKSCFNQIFNIGSDTVSSINQVAALVSASLGQPQPTIKYLPARKESKNAFSNHEKIKKYLGIYLKNTNLEEGIKKMALWAKKTGPQKTQKFDKIEIRKNLLPSWRENFKKRENK
ncbi:MAG: NAD-dependent epimerase/dehydratase family protein [Patescibacteria group bacterium]|jgi:UDP-glucose 4-epimerase